jgi:hypothetical protein
VVLGTPQIHKGAQTYLAIDFDGNVELRSMSTPLKGNEKTAIPANFGWLVKDGKLVTTKVERTSSDASRSMVGVKADGSLIFCLFCVLRYGWGWKNFVAEANTGNGPKIANWMRGYMTFGVPVIIAFILFYGLYTFFA